MGKVAIIPPAERDNLQETFAALNLLLRQLSFVLRRGYPSADADLWAQRAEEFAARTAIRLGIEE